MPDQDFLRAKLIPADPKTRKAKPADAVPVHFNPESLKLTRSNGIKADTKGSGQRQNAAQHIDSSSSKLAFDLVFDTTLEEDEATGFKDVREVTRKLVKLFMDPGEPQASGGKAPKPVAAPLCVFSWGAFWFTGIVESMNETVEFFSPNGVPLRSVLAVSMTEDRFDFTPDAVKKMQRAQPDFVPVGLAGTAPDAAQAGGGDPTGWRDTALFNGLETPRFPDAAALAVPRLSLEGSVGLSFGASASLGTGIKGAFGGGVSLGGTAALRLGRGG
ncbi:CIS tube protein [Paracraurococcus ruber]|uniref:Contractile injection system tube protein N-terminal domain-containing protein n=1 Tax=Paracraurococcus ruber TaxID=77675 RepID=A0ABS1CSX0_9PROT|nr:hypothetical protein [Paracraurococcus ruber]MBK1657107.1 hypothetical protein [Paracraurococcus ruber]TDG33405.1 hypothetical protein E2C05_04055 [Paracraurococcus ruber]